MKGRTVLIMTSAVAPPRDVLFIPFATQLPAAARAKIMNQQRGIQQSKSHSAIREFPQLMVVLELSSWPQRSHLILHATL
eukprot:CAMPEP_0198128296 /NCGR_PEP_ID=MMETSP1442-20131203/48995_1 /TAXON_ID= /ORGANISM="Craspedostauros australis, Strain CCMP3328" /LENGTH=79 /DNA_ID=CAMNT_0043788435 /DNA_START=343 /DNA_END=579 /DNA_ORIENTATION=+